MSEADEKGDIGEAQVGGLKELLRQTQTQMRQVSHGSRAQVLPEQTAKVSRRYTAIVSQSGQVEGAFKSVVQPFERPLQRHRQVLELWWEQTVKSGLEGEGVRLKQEAEKGEEQTFARQSVSGWL